MNIVINDGYNLCKEGFLVLKGGVIPLMPDFKAKTVDIPSRKGVWDFGDSLGVKKYTIPLLCTVQDVYERENKMNELIDLLTDDFGYPKVVKVKISIIKGYHFYAKLSKNPVPKRFNSSADIALDIVDNDARLISDLRAGDIVWGSETITFEDDYMLGNTGSITEFDVVGQQIFLIENIGRPTKPSIKLVGTGENIVIENAGQKFKVGNLKNETFEVDFNKFIAYKNGKEYNVYIDDFYLFKGDNNVKITGKNIKLQFSIDFNYER